MSLVLHAFIISPALSRVTYWDHFVTYTSVTHEIVKIIRKSFINVSRSIQVTCIHITCAKQSDFSSTCIHYIHRGGNMSKQNVQREDKFGSSFFFFFFFFWIFFVAMC